MYYKKLASLINKKKKMSLFTATVISKNGNTATATGIYSRTELFNTKNIEKVYENSSNQAVITYSSRGDKSVSPDEYVISKTRAQVITEMEKSEVVKTIEVSVAGYTERDLTPPSTVIAFKADAIVNGWDIDTSSCYVYVNEGAFKQERWKLNHTISELDQSQSNSGNLA